MGADRTLTQHELLDRLRARGWRVTPQRRAVVAALEGDHVHRTADQVHAIAREVVPEVSLATVYNTLNELVQLGEISELRLSDGSARYDPKTGPDHHHLVCRSCGRTVEVADPPVERWAAKVAAEHGFADVQHQLEVFGTCAACATR